MAHAHRHDHSPAISAEADRSKLKFALALILGFMAVEVVVGIIANSLALLSDAAWEVTSGFPVLSAHVLVDAETDRHGKRLALEHEIHERFGIDHTTLQVEHRHTGELLQVEVPSDSTP